MKRAAVALGAFVIGCASQEPTFPGIAAALRGSDVRCVLVDGDVTLFSPYSAATSAPFAALAAEEWRAVTDLLGAREGAQVSVVLLPAADEAQGAVDAALPAHEGVAGFVGRGAEAAIYVPRDEGSIGARDASPYRRTLRHELCHAWFRLAAIRLPRWLDEAVAAETASLIGTPLRDDPLPDALIAAHALAVEGALDAILDWDAAERAEPELYDLAQSFLRFHRERSNGRPMLDVARELASRSHTELRADEDAWLRWLRELDVSARLLRCLDDPDPSVRVAATFRLLAVAEHWSAAAIDPELDRRACARVEEGDFAAIEYVLRFRATELSAERVAQLRDSAAPVARVVGLALEKLRGEPPSSDAAAAWRALGDDERLVAFRAGAILGTR